MNITSGADIIAVIILIALAIAIIVYLLHWLYRRSSKEIAFVRTGMGGERVVISGGAFVLPIIHNITSVGMKTLCIEVQRNGNKSFITKNRMRAEVTAEFYVRVAPTNEAVSIAAQTLGNRTLEPDHLKELVQGRFVDGLGVVAAKMSLDEIQENRSEYIKKVATHVEEAIKHTGLELETVSLTSLNQAPVSVFDPSNTFDAEGLTQITEFTQSRKKKRNDIEKDTEVSIRNKNLQSIKQTLEIEKEEEFSKYQQKREIEQQRAIENTETIKTKADKEKESELAEIASEKDIEIARISKKDFVEMEKSLQETKLIQEIEKRRKEQNEIRQQTTIEIKQKDIDTEKTILELEGEEGQFEYLIDIGKKKGSLEPQEKIDKNKMSGCLAQVWIKFDTKNGKNYFDGDSDALIVKGLVKIITEALSGLTNDEIKELKHDIVNKLGLGPSLSARRQVGMMSMVDHIKIITGAK